MGPRAGLDGRVKSRPPPGFDPRTFRIVTSQYLRYIYIYTHTHTHIYINGRGSSVGIIKWRLVRGLGYQGSILCRNRDLSMKFLVFTAVTKENCLMGCDNVQSGTNLPQFRRRLLSPSSELKNKQRQPTQQPEATNVWFQ